MADQPRRRRNRPDSKQMWDESDRRSRHEPDVRDKQDSRNRDREDPPRERDRRYRSRSRSPRRDRRERPRDRRDRDRNNDKNKPRENDRPQIKEENHHERPGRDRRRNKDDVPVKGPTWERSPRRSASPTRSPADKLGRNSHNSPLPTRPRPGAGKSEHSTSLQFKVGIKHEERHKSANRSLDGRASSEDDPESRGNRTRTKTPNSQHGDAMDEDEDEDGDDVVVEDDGLSAMQAMMGFGGFGTTKNSHIPGNNAGAVRKEKKTEYRQYMNRIGGFNRPLSPSR